jgi:hypothetical protein
MAGSNPVSPTNCFIRKAASSGGFFVGSRCRRSVHRPRARLWRPGALFRTMAGSNPVSPTNCISQEAASSGGFFVGSRCRRSVHRPRARLWRPGALFRTMAGSNPVFPTNCISQEAASSGGFFVVRKRETLDARSSFDSSSPRRRGSMPGIEERFTTCADRSKAWIPAFAGMTIRSNCRPNLYGRDSARSEIRCPSHFGSILVWGYSGSTALPLHGRASLAAKIGQR